MHSKATKDLWNDCYYHSNKSDKYFYKKIGQGTKVEVIQNGEKTYQLGFELEQQVFKTNPVFIPDKTKIVEVKKRMNKT